MSFCYNYVSYDYSNHIIQLSSCRRKEKLRNPYFDNIKAILIVLVVLGHTLSEVFTANQWISSIYMFIYLFHMPAFILISGYFAKRITSFRDILKLAEKLLVPYVIFQVCYTLYYNQIFGDQCSFSLSDPRWGLWFLISLFCWNLMLSIFRKRKKALLIAILISLFVGYFTFINEYFTLSRTFFFFPFFLCGFLMEKKHFNWMKQKWNVWLSSIGLVIIFILVYNYGNIEWREWFYGRIGYENISSELANYGLFIRAFVYILMGITTYCFLAIVTNKQLFFTKVGKQTFPIYIFHMFIIKFVHDFYILDWIMDNHYYFLLFIIPIMVVYLLTREPFITIGAYICKLNRWKGIIGNVQKAR